jgi:ATP-dependent Lon protease
MLAAHRAGIKTFILPEQNRKDLPEIPDEVKQAMELVMVKHVDEVLERALLAASPKTATPAIGYRPRVTPVPPPGTVNRLG